MSETKTEIRITELEKEVHFQHSANQVFIKEIEKLHGVNQIFISEMEKANEKTTELTLFTGAEFAKFVKTQTDAITELTQRIEELEAKLEDK
jgi:uncharacterized coiled-coil protein SlyX